MKFLNALTLYSLFTLCYLPLFAADIPQSTDYCQNCCAPIYCYDQASQFGTASFAVTDTSLWYTLNTNSFPETVPLSQNRNKGVSEGNVFLSPTGFTIGEAGNYWISVTAVLQNPGTDAALIPIFLVLDETFNFDDPSLIGGAASVQPDDINTVHATGIMKNIPAGARVSLVATNGGNPAPQSINVVYWSISLFKLP